MLNVEPCNLSCRTMNKQIQEGKGEGSADFLESFKISQLDLPRPVTFCWLAKLTSM